MTLPLTNSTAKSVGGRGDKLMAQEERRSSEDMESRARIFSQVQKHRSRARRSRADGKTNHFATRCDDAVRASANFLRHSAITRLPRRCFDRAGNSTHMTTIDVTARVLRLTIEVTRVGARQLLRGPRRAVDTDGIAMGERAALLKCKLRL
jgi:hypothetical protein